MNDHSSESALRQYVCPCTLKYNSCRFSAVCWPEFLPAADLLLPPAGGGGAPADPAAQAEAEAPNPLAALKELPDVLSLMDAVIQLNNYLPKLLLYRDVQVPPEAAFSESAAQTSEDASTSPEPPAAASSSLLASSMAAGQPDLPKPASLDLLWEWSCDMTAGLSCTCVSWNPARPDLLAAGYGPADYSSGADGLVAFWSLKNPEYPLWTFPTIPGVSAVDFSGKNPNILAVGLYDGTVAMFDVKTKNPEPSMVSTAATGKHSDPVWKVSARRRHCYLACRVFAVAGNVRGSGEADGCLFCPIPRHVYCSVR